MNLSERQKEILYDIIDFYFRTAAPVSSKFLEKKYRFRICSATIRTEMQKLAEEGFIFQPHTSAGRVPTDKGYRFFVDELFEKELSEKVFDLDVKERINKDNEAYLSFSLKTWTDDSIKFIQLATKNLAEISSNLALGYLSQEKIFWKDGWEKIIKEPEFGEKKVIDSFIVMIEEFEEELNELKINCDIKVYIGKENPFSDADEFSTIISGCHLPEKENGVLAIMGPKRMDYKRNIGLMNFLLGNLDNKKNSKIKN